MHGNNTKSPRDRNLKRFLLLNTKVNVSGLMNYLLKQNYKGASRKIRKVI